MAAQQGDEEAHGQQQEGTAGTRKRGEQGRISHISQCVQHQLAEVCMMGTKPGQLECCTPCTHPMTIGPHKTGIFFTYWSTGGAGGPGGGNGGGAGGLLACEGRDPTQVSVEGRKDSPTSALLLARAMYCGESSPQSAGRPNLGAAHSKCEGAHLGGGRRTRAGGCGCGAGNGGRCTAR